MNIFSSKKNSENAGYLKKHRHYWSLCHSANFNAGTRWDIGVWRLFYAWLIIENSTRFGSATPQRERMISMNASIYRQTLILLPVVEIANSKK